MPGGTFTLADAFAAFGVVVADGAMTANGNNPYMLNSATAAFKRSDVGKKITVAGAGAGGANLTTKIASYVSATKVLLAAPAQTTVSGANISYVKGIYRISDLLAQGDVDGNTYQVIGARRLSVQVGPQSPGGVVHIGGPYVSPTNAGVSLAGGESDNFAPGSGTLAMTSDYICSDTASQKVNIMWEDDLNISTAA